MLFPGRRRYEARPATGVPVAVDGIEMGSWLAGDMPADVRGGRWYWPREAWTRHALVLGAPGSGKTESVLRLAYELAGAQYRGLPVQVLYLDAKSDSDLPGRFGALMAAQGRRTHFFPERRIDLWRGDWRALRERLMRVVPYASAGGPSWYRDIAGVLMEYVCSTWPEPPYSSAELFRRFVEAGVMDESTRHPLLASIDAEKVDDVVLRYQNFFGSPGLLFDGELGFEDLDTGYFRIDSSFLGEESDKALCMLFLDFVHYCKARKPRDRLVVLVLDEFSAIARAFAMDRLAEELRSFNVSLVFVPQSLEGMGDEDQRLRLLKAARLKVVHRYEDPEPLIALAGRKLVPDFSFDLAAEEAQEEEGRVRWVERWRVAPEAILRLGVGEAVVFREGLASEVAMARSPRPEPLALPEPESIDRVYEWSRGGEGPAVAEGSDPDEDEAGVEAEADVDAEESAGEAGEAEASKRYEVSAGAEMGSEVVDQGEGVRSSGSPSAAFGEEV